MSVLCTRIDLGKSHSGKVIKKIRFKLLIFYLYQDFKLLVVANGQNSYWFRRSLKTILYAFNHFCLYQTSWISEIVEEASKHIYIYIYWQNSVREEYQFGVLDQHNLNHINHIFRYPHNMSSIVI